MLFCENETNVRRLWGMKAPGEYFKDGINDYIVNGDRAAVNPERLGTKLAAALPDDPARGRHRPIAPAAGAGGRPAGVRRFR